MDCAALAERVVTAAAREWSDDLEAVSGVLGAAGVLDAATAARRAMSRDLVRRKATATDVATWAVHHLQLGRGAGWLLQALRANPEAVWRARGLGAREVVVGAVHHLRAAQVVALVERIQCRWRFAAGSLAPSQTDAHAKQGRHGSPAAAAAEAG